jgi:propionate CoA-transferase
MAKTVPQAEVAIIRATYADEDGNLSMCDGGAPGLELDMALAVHNNGGIVIAQVEEIVRRGTIPAKQVCIQARLVDYIVKVQSPDGLRQRYGAPNYRPAVKGGISV